VLRHEVIDDDVYLY